MSALVSSVLMACCLCWCPCWNQFRGGIMVIESPHTVSVERASSAAIQPEIQPVKQEVHHEIARQPSPTEGISTQVAQGLLDEWKKALESRDMSNLVTLYENGADAHKWSSIVTQSSQLTADLRMVDLSGDFLAFDCNLAYRLGGKGGVWKKRYAWKLGFSDSGIRIVDQQAL